MEQLTTSRFAIRVLMAVMAVCLIVAPISGDCCVRAACQDSSPAKSSESPCHAGMAAHHKAKAKCHVTESMCSDSPLLSTAVPPDEFSNNSVSIQRNQLVLFVTPGTGIFPSGALLIGNSPGSAEDSVPGQNVPVSISPLKL